MLLFGLVILFSTAAIYYLGEATEQQESNEKAAEDIKNFWNTCKDVIDDTVDGENDDSDEFNVTKTVLSKLMGDLSNYPYLNDFNSSSVVELNPDTYAVLLNLNKIAIAYSKIDWKYILTLQSNNFYTLIKNKQLDDIKLLASAFNSGN